MPGLSGTTGLYRRYTDVPVISGAKVSNRARLVRPAAQIGSGVMLSSISVASLAAVPRGDDDVMLSWECSRVRDAINAICVSSIFPELVLAQASLVLPRVF